MFKGCFNKHCCNFDDVSKIGYSILSWNEGVLNEGYDIIISANDVTNKILSCDSNDILDVVMWPKFGNSSISMGEIIITSILWGFHQKK